MPGFGRLLRRPAGKRIGSILQVSGPAHGGTGTLYRYTCNTVVFVLVIRA